MPHGGGWGIGGWAGVVRLPAGLLHVVAGLLGVVAGLLGVVAGLLGVRRLLLVGSVRIPHDRPFLMAYGLGRLQVIGAIQHIGVPWRWVRPGVAARQGVHPVSFAKAAKTARVCPA